jgi:glutathione peroxidase
MNTIYDINIKKKDGTTVPMAQYKDQVLLIVNTATACGFTPQYDELQELYENYKNQGFRVLDFPSNQFGKQAPGTDQEITDFCNLNFNISFDQYKKIDVNGDKESDLFRYLKASKKGMMGSSIKWNFTKFLVDKNGTVIKRYAPTVKPSKIAKDIEKLL